MHVIKKNILNIFSKKEILSEEIFYGFKEKKKIVTYVPEDHADKLMSEMSKAGAGKIGNYEMCSFRIQGTGTFKPGAKATPFKGQKNKISFEEEIRFEMECDTGKLNGVLDVMLKHHPYEEVAYEINNFFKRGNESLGIIITLKKKLSLSGLLNKMNTKINSSESDDEISIGKIAFTNVSADKDIIRSAEILECDYLITVLKNKFNLYKII